MAVPKRKMSRSNTRHRRSQWKATATTLTATVEGGQTVYSRPHMAKVVVGSDGRQAEDGGHGLRDPGLAGGAGRGAQMVATEPASTR